MYHTAKLSIAASVVYVSEHKVIVPVIASNSMVLVFKNQSGQTTLGTAGAVCFWEICGFVNAFN